MNVEFLNSRCAKCFQMLDVWIISIESWWDWLNNQFNFLTNIINNNSIIFNITKLISTLFVLHTSIFQRVICNIENYDWKSAKKRSHQRKYKSKSHVARVKIIVNHCRKRNDLSTLSQNSLHLSKNAKKFQMKAMNNTKTFTKKLMLNRLIYETIVTNDSKSKSCQAKNRNSRFMRMINSKMNCLNKMNL